MTKHEERMYNPLSVPLLFNMKYFFKARSGKHRYLFFEPSADTVSTDFRGVICDKIIPAKINTHPR